MLGEFRRQATAGAWVGEEGQKVRGGLWPTGQNEEDLGVLLRNLVGVIEGF